MSKTEKVNSGVPSSNEVVSMKDIENQTGNLYRSIYIISKRSHQIQSKIREELHSKLEEFASHTDNLEEVHENREQIEMSRAYEKMPKSTLISLNEFVNEKIYYRATEEDNADNE